MRTGQRWAVLCFVTVLALAAPGTTSAADPAPAAPSAPVASQPGTIVSAGPSLATPEDAVRAYLAGIASGDAGAILGSIAADQMSAGFDFAAQVERLQAILPNDLAPAEYPLFADIDRSMVSARILGQAKMLVYSLLSTETMDGSVIAPADRARADGFVSQVDPSRLAGLTVQDIRYSNARLEHDPRTVSIAAKQAAIYGADELTERIALIDLDGQLYEVGFTLLRYGDDWRISSQSAALGDTPALGTAVPTTREGYDRHTSGE